VLAHGPAGWPYATSTKLLPPLRTAADRAALCAGVADGTLVVVSDHWPRRAIEKDCEYAYAAPGASALESVLGVLLELVARGELALAAALRALTVGPAAAFGLEGGCLAPGAPADCVVFDPEPRWPVDPARWRSRGRSTPLAGQWLRGRVRATIVGGEIVYRE
jgi:dihydroorotase